VRLLFILLCLCVAPAAFAQQGQPAPEVLNRVYACAEIADNSQRLACFDAAVGGLKQADQQGEFAGIDRQQAQEVERDSFGLSLPSLGRIISRSGADGARLEDMQMTIERVIERANGRYAFVMANGQTWVQTETQRVHNARAGDAVTIKRAALGSFMMSSSRGGSAHRVRREN
jgi:hypothetical protein